MSDSNLPELITRHHTVTVKSKTLDQVLDFCTNGLMIPVGHVARFERAMDMDSFWIYTYNGCRFMVSSPELLDWEARQRVCAPERKEFLDEG